MSLSWTQFWPNYKLRHVIGNLGNRSFWAKMKIVTLAKRLKNIFVWSFFIENNDYQKIQYTDIPFFPGWSNRKCLEELKYICQRPLGGSEERMECKGAVFYRTYPILYHKFVNMVIFPSEKLHSLYSPGNQDYQLCFTFSSKKR